MNGARWARRVAGAARRFALPALMAALPALFAPPVAADEVKIDSETFGGSRARSIGPAAMSGRIATLDAVRGDRLTICVGAAGGGVWKSMDAGTSFEPAPGSQIRASLCRRGHNHQSRTTLDA